MRIVKYYRYLIVDCESGILARFKNEIDVPFFPIHLIQLEDIVDVVEVDGGWLFRKSQFYFKINYGRDKSILLSCSDDTTRSNWIYYLRLAVGFVRFTQSKLENFKKIGQKYQYEQMCAQLITEDQNKDINIDDLKKKMDFPTPPSEQLSTNHSLTQVKINSVRLADFRIIKHVGKGSYGNVFKVVFIPTNKSYALKQMKKQTLIQNEQLKYAMNECQILRQLDSPFIIRLHYAF